MTPLTDGHNAAVMDIEKSNEEVSDHDDEEMANQVIELTVVQPRVAEMPPPKAASPTASASWRWYPLHNCRWGCERNLMAMASMRIHIRVCY